MLRNPNGLAYAVMALLGVDIAFDLFLGVVDLDTLSDPDAYGAADFAGVGLAAVYTAAFFAYAATAVVFVIWFHRLRLNAEVWAGDLQGRRPGWAVGGWFIPFAFYWIPRQVAADIWRASRPDPYGADGRGELTLLNAWWTFWVVSNFANLVSVRLDSDAETTGELLTAVRWSLSGYLLEAVAGVLAVLFVRRLTSMQHAKATGMIPATG
ncbi:DUF4328 domain-containing protein [Streptomyces filamentosus]|uniref:DUF4328 domain-containing protein n=1 Tax=Streptomyces filamentosus TaxID=67294 RepID=UPI00123B61CE|nr:DUF4328 domain-containing protein [Streptomyces filamentosus]KAA6219297.1 DUF4328 domain-containing protein [Streptomyces filamentosus]